MIHDNEKINLVIGCPLGHSKSPILHNTAYQLLNCNAVMQKHETRDLSSIIQKLRSGEIGFAAITMPYKKEILSALDQQSAAVKKLKAANTVIYRDQQLIGYNTDVDGIAYALRNMELKNKSVLVIGAGGAAHAAGYFLQQQQAKLFWLNRTPAHAQSMIELFGGKLAQLDGLPLDVIINTTPVGMFPDVNQSPLPDYPFKAGQVVFDMVYNPEETLFLGHAKAKGAVTISGLDMFIGQGLRQIELWLQKKIEPAEIINQITAALRRQA